MNTDVCTCLQKKLRTRTACGFTLIELLVVIAIIAILIGLLLPANLRKAPAGDQLDCVAIVSQGVGRFSDAAPGFGNVTLNFAGDMTEPFTGKLSIFPCARQTGSGGGQ